MDPALPTAGGLPRIAMVATHGYMAAVPPPGAPDTGDRTTYVLELSKKLAQMGFEVDILTRRFASQPEIETVAAKARIVRIPCAGRGFIRKEDLWEFLPEWCDYAIAHLERRKLSYEFVQSHYWDGGIAGQFLADALGVPHLHTPHSLGLQRLAQCLRDHPQDRELMEARHNLSRRVLEERRLYGNCHLILATARSQLDALATDYDVPTDKLRMVPPGYDDHRFFPVSEQAREGIRRRLGFEGTAILALGRLSPNSGYDLLLDAFRLTASRIPDAILHVLPGPGDLSARELRLRSQLRSRAERLGIAGRVRFGTGVPEQELPDHYRAADLFVLPHRGEPLGMGAIEAMASGTPAVITVQGGLHRALSYGRHALFADPFDPEDLGITMTGVFRHEGLRQRLARFGAHRARSLFTWTGVAQQVLSLAQGLRSTSVLADEGGQDEPWIDSD